MSTPKQREAALVLLALLAVSCADGQSEPFELSTAGDEIINGTQPADGSQQALGVVHVTFDGGSGSGTLLSNQFVLTARHVVRFWDGTNWGASLFTNLQARLDGPGNVDQTIPASVVFEGSGNPQAGDYAILQLQRPVTINGWSDALYNPIYASADSTLAGKTATCVGYGNNAWAVAGRPGVPATGQTGAGILRTANLVLQNAGGNVLTTTPNSATPAQVVTAGDSGSTCFFNGQVTGIHSTCTGNGPDVDGDGKIATWEFSSITSCAYASPGAYRTWAQGILLTAVTMPPFAYSPATSATVQATLRSVMGTTATTNTKTTTTTSSNMALRSGWLELRVSNEPPGMMCTVERRAAATSGTPSLKGACLGDGLVVSSVLTI
jgi:hypothetical protein